MAKPHRHGKKWRVRWTDLRGKLRSRVFVRYDDAQRFLDDTLAEITRAREERPEALEEARTFSDLAEHWIEIRCPQKRSAKDDISMLRRHLRPYYDCYRLDEITHAEIQRFALSRDLRPKTVHNLLTLLGAMLTEAVDMGWLLKRPKIRKPKISAIAGTYSYLKTPEEVQRFLKAARNESWFLYALYATAIYTGMRQGELAGLLWEDVDLGNRLICIRRSFDGPTKNGETRYAPILDPLLPILTDHKHSATGAYVFPTETGTMQQPSARIFQEKLHAVLDAAKFPRVERHGKERRYITFHGLRHTFASHWMMNGGDIFKLQRIGGWKSFSMVQRYAHLAPEAFAADYDRMSNLAG